jgi:aldose 1-epimerase
MDITPDSEVTLSIETQRVVVSPWGAALRRYSVTAADGEEIDIVWGYSGGAHKKGGQGDVLIPFPGRVAEGRYSFDGRSFQLERNDKEGPNAIHGFVRTLPWKVRDVLANGVTFDLSLDATAYGRKGYPFSLAISVTYGLDHRGLSCSFAVQNVGRQAAPVGVGFHPYFTVGTALIDEADAKIPCAGYVEFNERLVPTGTILDVTGGEWDYRRYRQIGSRRFNHCYVDLERDQEGMATASLRHVENGRAIDIVMDRSFSAIVVYTGDAIVDAPRRALAIEPMTCATDALNHPEWGLKRLLPEETFSGRYLIRSRRDNRG